MEKNAELMLKNKRKSSQWLLGIAFILAVFSFSGYVDNPAKLKGEQTEWQDTSFDRNTFPTATIKNNLFATSTLLGAVFFTSDYKFYLANYNRYCRVKEKAWKSFFHYTPIVQFTSQRKLPAPFKEDFLVLPLG